MKKARETGFSSVFFQDHPYLGNGGTQCYGAGCSVGAEMPATARSTSPEKVLYKQEPESAANALLLQQK